MARFQLEPDSSTALLSADLITCLSHTVKAVTFSVAWVCGLFVDWLTPRKARLHISPHLRYGQPWVGCIPRQTQPPTQSGTCLKVERCHSVFFCCNNSVLLVVWTLAPVPDDRSLLKCSGNWWSASNGNSGTPETSSTLRLWSSVRHAVVPSELVWPPGIFCTRSKTVELFA